MKATKKIISILLSFVLVITAFYSFPFAVSAAENNSASVGAISGTTGECIWALDDNGTLTISGNGKMADYDSESAIPWYNYKEKIYKLILNEGVTRIGSYSFAFCDNLLEIESPDSLNEIGKYAFLYTAWYEEQDNNNSLIYLGNVLYEMSTSSNHYVMEHCSLKAGTVSIADYAFANDGYLKTITLPDSLKYIGKYAFYNCSSLCGVSMDSVVEIGEYAFSDCHKLLKCHIGNSTQNIDKYAFCNSGLERVWMSESIRNIGEGAFLNCKDLKWLYISSLESWCKIHFESLESNPLFYSTVMYLNETPIRNLIIPDTIEEINPYAFVKNERLDSISIPASVNCIGDYAFYYCRDIYLIAPEMIGLQSVSFGSSIKKIGSNAFDQCISLKNVKFSGNINDWNSIVINDGNDALLKASIYFSELLDISLCSLILENSSFDYDGTAKRPSVTVNCDSTTLTEDTDYTVSYSNNTNAGTATVTITGKGGYTGSTTKSFTINPKSISSATVTLSPISYTYDGTEKKPSVTVKDGTKTLTSGTDYSVSYSNNVDVGTATVTVTGKNNYTGSTSKTFTITEPEKINISNCTITLSPTSFTYDGTAKQPSVTVKYGSTTLTKDTDYTVSYSNNTNAGTATVTITGKGGYTGSTTKNFTINAKSISSATVTLSPTSYTYDGAEKKPSVTVKDGTNTLTSGTDYSVSYSNNVNVGTATITVSGKNNYSGFINKTFTITEPEKTNISNCTITLSPTSYTYDGTAKQPSVTVKYGSTTLTKDTDYTVSYSNNTNAGTATVTITGKGGYTGSATKEFTINAKSISSATVTLSPTSYTYDGTEKKPSVAVKDGTKTLINGTDYTVSYSNNVNVGTATITVTGKENYTDSKTLEFTIRNNEGVDDKNRLLGDADGDGKISISDATIIQKYLAEYPVTNKFTVVAADVNESGTITIIDATCIQKYLAEYTISERIGYPISDTEKETTWPSATEPTTTAPVATEPPTDQVIEYDNGDYVYVPSEENLEYDAEEAALYYNNTISVYLTKDISANEEQRLAGLCNGEVVGRIKGVINSMQIKIAPTDLNIINSICDELMADNSVLFAIYESLSDPDTNTDGNPWSYKGKDEPQKEKGNEDDPNGNDWWAEAIGAYTAWGYADSGYIESPAAVGVFDNGIDVQHEEFRDSNGNSKITVVGDETIYDHGTHVAGIMAAQNNTVGIRGVADKSKIFWCNYRYSYEDTHNVFNQMIDSGVHLINHSYGVNIKSKDELMNELAGVKENEDNKFEKRHSAIVHLWIKKLFDSNVYSADDIYNAYIRYLDAEAKYSAMHYLLSLVSIILQDKDVLMVESAGNEPNDTTKNGYYCTIDQNFFNYLNEKTHNKLEQYCNFNKVKEHIMVVGAVSKDKKGDNYKLANDYSFGDNIDIVAPGEDILSTVTVRDDNLDSDPDYKGEKIKHSIDGLSYARLPGTSMAAPMVTGSAALLRSLDPTLTLAEIKDILVNKTAGTAVKSNRKDARATYPMLNVGNAVEYVMSHRLHKRLVDDKPFMQQMVEMHFEGESISSAAELQQKLSDDPYGTFYLTNDIEGDDEINNFWYTIPEFHGTLYGNGYTIKELFVNGGEAALFRNIENAEIRDLGFDSITATALFANGTYAGIIAAFADSCIIENCYAVNSKVTSTYMAGSFTAYARNTKFINLYSDTAVSGLCGMGSNTDTDFVSGSIGGITGYYENRQPDSDSFVNCRVKSVITAEVSSENYIKSGNICVGGIVGDLNATTGSPQRPMDSNDEDIPPTPIAFSNCQFNGEVRGYGGTLWYSEELSSGKTLFHTADVYSGGLIGNAKTDWGSGTGAWSGIVHVIDSSVTGTVIADTKGTACAGGVIGHAQVFTESGNGVLIRNTSFNGSVNTYYQEDDKCDIAYIGTMIGSNNFHCLLDSTKSSGTINAKSGWAIYAGKLIGDDVNSQTNVSDVTVNVTMNIDSDATDSWRHIGGNIGSV